MIENGKGSALTSGFRLLQALSGLQPLGAFYLTRNFPFRVPPKPSVGPMPDGDSIQHPTIFPKPLTRRLCNVTEWPPTGVWGRRSIYHLPPLAGLYANSSARLVGR
jgi:hypothetical protein